MKILKYNFYYYTIFAYQSFNIQLEEFLKDREILAEEVISIVNGNDCGYEIFVRK